MMKIKGFNQKRLEGSDAGQLFLPHQNFEQISLKKKYENRLIIFLKIGIIFITLILISFLIYLQVFHGNYYKNLAEKNRVRIQEIKPLRGIIYDRNRISLVQNKPNFTMLATPSDIYSIKGGQIDKIIENIKNLYPEDPEINNMARKLQTISYVPIVLKKNITYEQGIKLIPIIEEWPGVYLLENFNREYIYDDIMSHILGYTGFVSEDDLINDPFYTISDIKGKTGIEAIAETKLRGIKGQKQIQVNSIGKEGKLVDYIYPQKGFDVFLTIDLKLQEELTRILQEQMNKFNVQKACAVVLDPNNGEILGMVSLPSFNSNLFTSAFDKKQYEALLQNPNNPLINRVISGEYPPGSTFKLIVGAGALEEGIIDKNFTVVSTGGIRVGEWFFPDWAPLGHGEVNIKGALSWSVNTYFYTIGGGNEHLKGLGLDGIIKYARLFNLGQTVGIDLPNEAPGFLPSQEWKLSHKKERWYLGDTYHLSIGQGDILVTPLQIALWTSFFANNGSFYKPHIVKQKVQTLNPIGVDKNIISSHNISLIREGLREAVRSGSARSLNSLNIDAAGKTGTAEFANNKKPHGWFTGFAPFNDPKIVITLLMEEGDGAGSAVPVARDFFDWYFKKVKFQK